MTVCLAIIGCAISVRATTDNELSLEDKAKPLADFLKQTMFEGGPSSIKAREIIRDNKIPKDAYIATIEKIAEECIADTVVFTNYQGKITKAFRRGLAVPSLINCIGSLGDPEFLPWLEQQAVESQWSGIRESASIAYVKIAELDATPFVQRILTGSDEKYDFNCKYLVTKEFFEQIAKAKSEKTPQKKIDAAYVMLIELAQSVAYEGHADRIDRFLCEHLEGYRSSVQREEAVRRFIDSTNDLAKTDFIKKHSEVLRTPKAQRFDFRQRFTGLTETDVRHGELPAKSDCSTTVESDQGKATGSKIP